MFKYSNCVIISNLAQLQKTIKSGPSTKSCIRFSFVIHHLHPHWGSIVITRKIILTFDQLEPIINSIKQYSQVEVRSHLPVLALKDHDVSLKATTKKT